MNEKITIWIATSEWNSSEGLFVTARPFRALEEAVQWAELECNEFVRVHGEDCENDGVDESGGYVSYYDCYVNIDITKHEL